jgi:predicted amidohydrolase
MQQHVVRNVVRTVIAGFSVIPGDTVANLQTVEAVLAAHAGIDLFVLPELCLCGQPKGLDIDALSRLAEEVPGGPSVQRMLALAQQYRTTVCAGIVEVDDHYFFFTHFLCGPGGYIGKQRKLFPSRGLPQSGVVEGGRSLHLMDVFGIRCAIVACADWLLPEAPYIASLHDTELLLAPTDTFTMADIPLLQHIAFARALDSGAHLLVSFDGDSTSDGPEPSGLVANRDRDGVTHFATREPDELKVTVLDLVIEPPRRRHGSARDRVNVIRDAVKADGKTA